MTPLVASAVLLAAVTHAAWNALAHRIRDQLLAFSLVGGGGTLCALALLPFAALPHARAWPYLIASVLIHLAYQYLLMRSFRLGEFGQVYPIARGVAPLAVTVLAALFVGEEPGRWQLAGVLTASAGLGGLALWGIRGHRPNWPALTAAVGTGLTIALYTTVDGVGVRGSGTSLGYVCWLLILQGSVIPAVAIAARRGRLLSELRPFAVRGLLAGALSTAAYGLVLWAQTRADLAPVAALRETSIIAGAAIASLFFKERFGRPRLLAAVVVVGGIGLMLHAG
ncbi:EamA-like transporter family protein [Streptomyces sp. DvalAA-14]|uniref:DMT family transporter n=1 Tax=unclassified Streptomyces TaxID=2593676 RepID=UPI00081AFF76|nr:MULTISPECIES: DMT family transporter [unclassified Streptomyces]MYS19672.1 EamA family transporter [Streptomyces sp. SID4948]SCD50226.1 EamA-like transporter family protein [Streptomyces sp. DvalAA-14]